RRLRADPDRRSARLARRRRAGDEIDDPGQRRRDRIGRRARPGQDRGTARRPRSRRSTTPRRRLDPGHAHAPRVRPVRLSDRVPEAAIVAPKAATIACAIDGFVNANTPRLRGKAIRTRAVGYTAGLFLVPAIWRILPDRGRYPRGLDLAVTLPLLIDAGGNALGLYDEAHLDDVVHVLNAAIVAGVAGALFASRTDNPWEAAFAGTGTAIAGETFWEI